MLACEYRGGPTANLQGITPTFPHELFVYLQADDLTKILGNEVSDMMCQAKFVVGGDIASLSSKQPPRSALAVVILATALRQDHLECEYMSREWY